MTAHTDTVLLKLELRHVQYVNGILQRYGKDLPKEAKEGPEYSAFMQSARRIRDLGGALVDRWQVVHRSLEQTYGHTDFDKPHTLGDALMALSDSELSSASYPLYLAHGSALSKLADAMLKDWETHNHEEPE